jgi:hypothetical protein
VVHGGPSEIADLFLTKDRVQNFDLHDVRNLRRTMNEFLIVCESALKLHKSILSSDKEQELHKLFEEHFHSLCEKIKKLNFPLPTKKSDEMQRNLTTKLTVENKMTTPTSFGALSSPKNSTTTSIIVSNPPPSMNTVNNNISLQQNSNNNMEPAKRETNIPPLTNIPTPSLEAVEDLSPTIIQQVSHSLIIWRHFSFRKSFF